MIPIGGFDLETTGLEQEKGHRIIEVALLIYDLETQAKVGKFVRRINPQRSIDPAAQAVHGISFEELENEPQWGDVAPDLAKVMSKCKLIVAHNGDSFDMPFVAAEFMRLGIAVPKVAAFDTMKQARWATPLGKYPSLKELCFACDILYEDEKAHAAEYDVQKMMECFFVGYQKGFYKPGLEQC